MHTLRNTDSFWGEIETVKKRVITFHQYSNISRCMQFDIAIPCIGPGCLAAALYRRGLRWRVGILRLA